MRPSLRERKSVSLLCFPEAILGGLADFSDNPGRLAIRADGGQLNSVLKPLASDTELGHDGALYNSAALYQEGRVVGLYRKVHPAIRRSVYSPGLETPVFRAGELTLGIVICNDSNDSDLVRRITAQSATALFIPTNNSMPHERASMKLNAAAATTDIALATENRIWVIRADVAGRNDKLSCFGSSEIVDPQGNVVRKARREMADLVVAEIDVETGE